VDQQKLQRSPVVSTFCSILTNLTFRTSKSIDVQTLGEKKIPSKSNTPLKKNPLLVRPNIEELLIKAGNICKCSPEDNSLENRIETLR
jgi:hypothetical protein